VHYVDRATVKFDPPRKPAVPFWHEHVYTDFERGWRCPYEWNALTDGSLPGLLARYNDETKLPEITKLDILRDNDRGAIFGFDLNYSDGYTIKVNEVKP